MRFERFTEKAQEALQSAAEQAVQREQQAVEPAHLQLALVQQPGGVAQSLLSSAGVNLPRLQAALVSEVERLPKVRGGGSAFLSNELERSRRADSSSAISTREGDPCERGCPW